MLTTTRLRFPLTVIGSHINHARGAPRHFHGLAG